MTPTPVGMRCPECARQRTRVTRGAVRPGRADAPATYVLIAILKKRLGSSASLSELLQILSVTPFEKTPLNTLFLEADSLLLTEHSANQLILFED